MARQLNSRERAASAFIRRMSFRSGAAIFTDGERIWSYGDHYAIAERLSETGEPEPIGVNESDYLVRDRNGNRSPSATTRQHRGAVKAALTEQNYRPTTETYEGSNGHTYRIWRIGG